MFYTLFYVHTVVVKMGNLIGSLGQGSPQTTPPPSPTGGVSGQRRGRKRGAEEARTEGGETEELVEELSPRRLVLPPVWLRFVLNCSFL